MKIGVLTAMWSDIPFEAALDRAQSLGLEAVELGTGNYAPTSHCNPSVLLEDEGARKRFQKALESRNLIVSALSCHGNPLHPNKEYARACHETHRKTVLLAEMLGIEAVCNFSGCPGDSPRAKYPNWVTCAWPPDYPQILEWQWKRKVIPYWKAESKFARQHRVHIAFEMHPGFVVYNPETLLKLRKHCGDNLGANFDPSHLFWQGIDAVAAIRALEGCIYHVHAKDTRVDPMNMALNGVLDTKNYTDEIHRSWIFRSVGYGHDAGVWKDIVSAFRMVGYDHVLSIEHEDSLMSGGEGLQKAVEMLRSVVIREQPGEAYWA
ncbi:MAG: sugar phosphate isomerase/epimerase [Armatimonadetes bacterium]|nr:sugar phosphate isomerase/epimerase [Armatimonadota bacterium]